MLTAPSRRPGLSLVEVLMFVTLMGMMSATVLPLLFNSTESRQRQDAIALVEQNGAQIMQVITQQVRSAELILDPPRGGTGFVLALQMADPNKNPTIIAIDSGAIIMVQGRSRRQLSSELVGATHFSVDNTSVSDSRQSVALSLAMRRIIRVLQPTSYESRLTTVVNLYPDDILEGNTCNCFTPYCSAEDDTVGDEQTTGTGTYVWGVCDDGVCIPYTGLDCDLID